MSSEITEMKGPSGSIGAMLRVMQRGAISLISTALFASGVAFAATANAASPTQPETGGWAQVSAGPFHTCAVAQDGTLWCWGYNTTGDLGTGDDVQRTSPAQVGTEADWVTVSSGGSSTCAIKTDESMWCWGDNFYGELGTGDYGYDSWVPVEVIGDHSWASVSMGFYDTCGIDTAGALWCWGFKIHGELGTGRPHGIDPTPTQVGTSSDWNSVTAGLETTCGIRASQVLRCWGDNEMGALGTGDTRNRWTPTLVDTTTRFQSAFTTQDHSCAIGSRNAAYCWGTNDHGQLGDGTTTSELTPEKLSLHHTWEVITGAPGFTCGLLQNHTVWCWGQNDSGQLGVGSRTDSTTPVQVRYRDWTALNTGGASCGIRADASLWCWGSNTYGQVGNGTTKDQLRPTLIPFPG